MAVFSVVKPASVKMVIETRSIPCGNHRTRFRRAAMPGAEKNAALPGARPLGFRLRARHDIRSRHDNSLFAARGPGKTAWQGLWQAPSMARACPLVSSGEPAIVDHFRAPACDPNRTPSQLTSSPPTKRLQRRNLICKPRKNRRAHVNHYRCARVPVVPVRGCEWKSWVCFERGLVRGVSVNL